MTNLIGEDAVADQPDRPRSGDSDSDDDVIVFRGRGGRGAKSRTRTTAQPTTEHDSINTSPVKAITPCAHNRAPHFSKLERLPQELKDLILEQVERNDLPKLAQASRTLHTAVLPFLYRDVAIFARRRDPNDIFTTDTPDQLLLRTLTKWPQYGALIKNLRFLETDQWIADPNPVLAFCTKLQTFEIHFVLDQVDARMDYINASKLSQGLEQVKDTLTQLRITYDLHSMNGEYCHPEVYGNCSLKFLSHLEKASIPLCVLLGWDPDHAPSIKHVLPSNLIELNIEEDHWENETHKWHKEVVQEQLEDFVRGGARMDATPNLKILNVVRDMPWWEVADTTDLDRRDSEFKTLCADNNIICKEFRL